MFKNETQMLDKKLFDEKAKTFKIVPNKKTKKLKEKTLDKEIKLLNKETFRKESKMFGKEALKESKTFDFEISKKKVKTLNKETLNKNSEFKKTSKKKAETLNRLSKENIQFDRKEFLAIRCQNFRLKAIEERLERIRTAISLAKPNMSDMPGVPRDSMKSDLSAKMTELLNISSQYSNMLVDWNLQVAKIEKQIESLPIGIYKILHYRYFIGLSWEKIAELVNYNVDYCRQLDRKYFKKCLRKSPVLLC